MNNPTVLIAGAGALGSLFAVLLNRAGGMVYLLEDWPAAVDRIRSKGVTLLIDENASTSIEVPVFTLQEDPPPFDYCLILVKSWQTEAYARAIARLAPARQGYLTLQNGLGNLEILSSLLKGAPCSAGVCLTGATLQSAAVVSRSGPGRVIFPEVEWLKPLASLMTKSGIQVEWEVNLPGLLWQKAIVNAAINPLTALLKVPNGALKDNLAVGEIIKQVVKEGESAARAAHIQLPDKDIQGLIEEICTATSENRSSMLQDLDRGRRTEIDAINGYLVRIGKSLGVEMHYNRLLWQLIQAAVNFQQRG